MHHHYFIGIKIPSQLGGLAEKYREQYSLRNAYKVLPHPDDLHVTLLFLGEVVEEQLPTITSKLVEIATNASPFRLHVNGLSYFGSKTGPRVIYLSLVSCEALTNLQESINASISTLLSMPRSDRFVPHITIAKKRKTTQETPIDKQVMEPLEIPVNAFSLFSIHPRKSPKYEEVISFELGG